MSELTDELQKIKATILAAIKDQAVSLNSCAPDYRDSELANLIGDCLPYGQELAELFAPNCEALDWTNLYRMEMDLEAWGCDPGEATTTDAIRYAITRHIIEEAEKVLEEAGK